MKIKTYVVLILIVAVIAVDVVTAQETIQICDTVNLITPAATVTPNAQVGICQLGAPPRVCWRTSFNICWQYMNLNPAPLDRGYFKLESLYPCYRCLEDCSANGSCSYLPIVFKNYGDGD